MTNSVQQQSEEICLNTRFGPITYTEESIISFPQGIFGFSGLKDFVLAKAPKAPIGEFLLLQSIEDETLTFLINAVPTDSDLIDPQDVSAACEALDLNKDETSILTIVSIHNEDGEILISTNLRAPVFICASKRLGYQHILQDNKYPIRHPLNK